MTGTFSWGKTAGALIILLGLMVKSWVDRKAQDREVRSAA